jgi:hypothetical protein
MPRIGVAAATFQSTSIFPACIPTSQLGLQHIKRRFTQRIRNTKRWRMIELKMVLRICREILNQKQ